jgi:hypothetical protein
MEKDDALKREAAALGERATAALYRAALDRDPDPGRAAALIPLIECSQAHHLVAQLSERIAAFVPADQQSAQAELKALLVQIESHLTLAAEWLETLPPRGRGEVDPAAMSDFAARVETYFAHALSLLQPRGIDQGTPFADPRMHFGDSFARAMEAHASAAAAAAVGDAREAGLISRSPENVATDKRRA